MVRLVNSNITSNSCKSCLTVIYLIHSRSARWPLTGYERARSKYNTESTLRLTHIDPYSVFGNYLDTSLARILNTGSRLRTAGRNTLYYPYLIESHEIYTVLQIYHSVSVGCRALVYPRMKSMEYFGRFAEQHDREHREG